MLVTTPFALTIPHCADVSSEHWNIHLKKRTQQGKWEVRCCIVFVFLKMVFRLYGCFRFNFHHSYYDELVVKLVNICYLPSGCGMHFIQSSRCLLAFSCNNGKERQDIIQGHCLVWELSCNCLQKCTHYVPALRDSRLPPRPCPFLRWHYSVPIRM